MKRFAKSLLAAGAGRLPWGARDALLWALVGNFGRQELLVRLAAEAGVTGFIGPGEHGAIQSAIGDRRILPEYVRTGSWAARTTAAFVRFFAERGGGTYLDIGANIGLTTLPVAANPAVRCIAFEPEPGNFANLADNVRRNARHGNVEMHQLALFDRAGALQFSLAADGNLGDHRVIKPGAAARGGRIEVAAARLDDVVAAPRGPLAVKLDAQGAEPFIIDGGRETLGRAELMVLEFSPMLIGQLGGDPDAVIEFVAGFERFEAVRGDSAEPPQQVAPEQIREFLRAAATRGRNDDRDYLDIYAERSFPDPPA